MQGHGQQLGRQLSGRFSAGKAALVSLHSLGKEPGWRWQAALWQQLSQLQSQSQQAPEQVLCVPAKLAA